MDRSFSPFKTTVRGEQPYPDLDQVSSRKIRPLVGLVALITGFWRKLLTIVEEDSDATDLLLLTLAMKNVNDFVLTVFQV